MKIAGVRAGRVEKVVFLVDRAARKSEPSGPRDTQINVRLTVNVNAKMAPAVPTTHPLVADKKCTPFKYSDVPLACAAQLTPPSLVAKIVPPSPTAQPAVAVAKCTSFKCSVVPFDCLLQLAPPSLVAKMLP